jgi:ABC-type amino acid transport substrate-binding protein
MKTAIFLLLLLCSKGHAQTLRVGAVHGPPHVLVDGPTPEGAAFDFFEKYVFPPLKKKFHLTVQWKSSPFKRELHELETNQLDMVFFMIKTPEREKLFNYSSEPFLMEPPGMIVAKNAHKAKATVSIKEFKGKTIGQMAGSTIPDYMKSHGINTFYLSGSDVGERLSNLVESRRIDGVFIHLSSITEYMVDKNNFINLKSVQIRDVPVSKVWIAYSKKLAPEIREEIDRLIAANRKFYKLK